MPVIPFWNKCNNNCPMCTNPDDFKDVSGDFSFSNIKKRIIAYKSGEKSFLIDNAGKKFYLTGGEPTMNPDFIKIVNFIKEFLPDHEVTLLTNGRFFVYPEFAKKILEVDGLSEIIIPIHGHNADIHDRVTLSPGSFKQTVAGLRNIFEIKKDKLQIEIRVILNGLNYKYIDEILSLIHERFYLANSASVIFMEYEGQAEKNINEVGLRYSEFKPYLAAAGKYVEKINNLRFYHFPLCVVDEHLWPFVWRTLPEYEVSFPDKCAECVVKSYCLGVHNNYGKLFGHSEFEPIKKDIKLIKSNNWQNPIEGIKK